MRAKFEFLGDNAWIIAALVIILSVMLGMTLMIDVLIHDRIAASVAGVAFTIGVATPLYNHVFTTTSSVTG